MQDCRRVAVIFARSHLMYHFLAKIASRLMAKNEPNMPESEPIYSEQPDQGSNGAQNCESEVTQVVTIRAKE